MFLINQTYDNSIIAIVETKKKNGFPLNTMFREFTVPEKLGNGISEVLNTTRSVAVASIFLSSMRASQKIHGYVIQKYPLFHCLYLNLTHSFY